MNVNISQFCSLSSNIDFRNWLGKIAPAMLNELVKNPRKGCHSNQEKMVEIHKRLYEIGKGQDFEELMRKRFPYLIKNEMPLVKVSPAALPPVKAEEYKRQQISAIETMNKHKVFKSYRPDILTFPHKYIIVGEPATLPTRIKEFAADKVGIDSIIIDDHAYIEYFLRRYSDVSEKIPRDQREIWAYRMKAAQK